MTKNEEDIWIKYYNVTEGRAPREILLNALRHFSKDFVGHATDIGCGTGNETLELINRGWRVLAIDQEFGAIYRLKKRTSSKNLETQINSFENMKLHSTDLVHASYAIPFCHPDKFNDLWNKITKSLNAGGIFVGHLFGENDAWNENETMTFHNKSQVKKLLEDYTIIKLQEEEEIKGTATKGDKYWHFFEIVAQKN